MPVNLYPVKLPQGVFRNGTSFEAAGRWADTNLVRWEGLTVRPIGGFSKRTVPSTGAVMSSLSADPTIERFRDLMAWTTNTGALAHIAASNKKVLYLNQDNVVTDVTPATFVGGGIAPVTKVGFGTGLYGAGPFGTPRLASGVTVTPVGRVSLDTWGEDAVFCEVADGKIYSYTVGDAIAVQIPNAPTDALGVAVTGQRILMAITKGRTVAWSARENRTDWTPAVANEAGSQFLAGEGELKSIHTVQDKQLILSETDAHIVAYTGPPYVYGFKRAASGCGPLSSTSAATTDKALVWAGQTRFWVYDGAVRELPCDVLDYFIVNRASGMDSKITTTRLPKVGEVWWFYQSSTGTDVDSYISYNYLRNYWATGRLARTAAIGDGATALPIMIDTDGIMWVHEQDGVEVLGAYAESGPLELAGGAVDMAVRAVLPDTAAKGDVQITLKGRSMPTEPDYSYGPYTYNNPTPTRAIGREIRIRVEGTVANWEVGTMRLDIATSGGNR